MFPLNLRSRIILPFVGPISFLSNISPSLPLSPTHSIKVAIDDKANANDAITKEANATETKEVKEVDAVPNSTTEVKTVPNEAPVANGNESKA